MRFLSILFCFSFITFYVDCKDEKELSFDCPGIKKYTGRQGKAMFKTVGACSRELSALIPDKVEFGNKFKCVLKCLMIKAKMVDEKHMLTNESWAGFAAMAVPENFVKPTQPYFEPCLTKFVGKLDPKDEICESYGNFIECLQGSFAKMMEKQKC